MTLSSTRLALDEANPELAHIGQLTWRGTLQLTSPNSAFGGLSGIVVHDGGNGATLVTDSGSWLTLHLSYDPNGILTGATGGRIGPLVGRDGATLRGKLLNDAEDLARLPDGGFLVAFERAHRIWRYAAADWPLAGVPQPTAPLSGIQAAPDNRGIEALTLLRDGRAVAIAEDYSVDGRRRGYVSGPSGWEPFAYARNPNFLPSGMATLPSGDLLVLERSFSLLGGFTSRLMRVPADDIAPGRAVEGVEIARLQPPLVTDNFEGVDARQNASGETLIYLVSDNNFSALQRTLIMMLALEK